ncbi:exotoxin beta-grasp domain-containing protein [Staphylococcus aureus]|uniref:exotoxin beta-grasp domain-containing protein n=1 Tax=Staphylococcus aureus TaxID=1280 RepID=UPI000C7B1A8E|nr:exotoxin [Staphylococcus aureus]AUJ57362.1 exotoxin [Staphylococcus aureus]AUW99899.1 exotoxin [Staphylococcus aureus]
MAYQNFKSNMEGIINLKKLYIFLIAISLRMLTNSEEAYADVGVQNLRNYYGSYEFTDLKNQSDKNNPQSHQLEYEVEGKALYSQLSSEHDVKRLKSKKVDIFGIPYTGITQNVEYIYGGITLSNDYLDNARNIPINLWINGQHKTISTDRVSTNKKQVTAQEIDVKLRRYLQEEYNIYGHNKTNKGREYGNESKFNSGFDKGNVIFHLNNGTQFSYDLFYTGHGQPEDFLKVYNDNKTIDSENFHLDVNLSLSKTI